MRIASFVVALGVVALSASRMAAQTCTGAASFSAGPIRLGAGLSSGDGFKSYGLNTAVGSRSGLFGYGDVGRAEFSDIDSKGTLYDIGAGYAFDLNSTRTLQFCPEIEVSHQSGPNFDYAGSTLTTSADAVGFGGSLGEVVPVTPTLDVVPFVGAAYAISQAWATYDGQSDTDSERYGEIDVGAGFVIHKTLTLQSSIAIPVGIEGAKSSFQLAFGFNFGSSH